MQKTVVITGSSRGLGFEMAKAFLKNGCNVVINGINETRLASAEENLKSIEGRAEVIAVAGDVANSEDIERLMENAVAEFGEVDIWINNAGVNQPYKAMWELTDEEINSVINTDLKGTIYGTRIAVLQMEKQENGGFIYNVEGYGSNDAMMLGFNMYGTGKRAVTHFTKAFARELKERNSRVKIGRLSPGMIVTDFVGQALGGKQVIEVSEGTKKAYNIWGDYPDVIADFLVKNMIRNTANDAHIEWLTRRKAFFRLLKAPFIRRDFLCVRSIIKSINPLV